MYKILVLVFLFSSSVIADDTISISSFGVVGLTMSDSEHYGFRTGVAADKGVYEGNIDLLSRSLIGLQVDASLSSELDAVGQVVLKDVVVSNLNNYISLAFLRYSPSSHWRFRIGRTPLDFFLVSSFQNVDFAYNWAVIPTEVYGAMPFKHIDGIDVDYTTRYLNGTLTTKVFTGKSYADIPTPFTTEHITINKILGFSTKLEKDDWTLQARVSGSTIADEGEANAFLIETIKQFPSSLWPNSANFAQSLTYKEARLTYYSIAFKKYINHWLFSSEVSRVNSSTSVVPQITSGYGSVAYQKNKNTFYGVGSIVTADNYTFQQGAINENNYPELIFGIEQLGNVYAFNQQSLSIGWRYDISSVVSSTVQLTTTRIDNNGGNLWVNSKTDLSPETVNTLFINVSWAL